MTKVSLRTWRGVLGAALLVGVTAQAAPLSSARMDAAPRDEARTTPWVPPFLREPTRRSDADPAARPRGASQRHEVKVLAGSDEPGIAGYNNVYFGSSMARAGDVLFVGSIWGDKDAATADPGPGSVSVFVKSDGNWREVQTLIASDGIGGDNFGYALAASGTMLLVGANTANVEGTEIQGAVYVFTLSGDTWIQTQKLTADDGETYSFFGIAVALQGDQALIGAAGATVAGDAYRGKVYSFKSVDGVWTSTGELVAGDGAGNDLFGYALALDGATALVGTPYANAVSGSAARGAAYVFRKDGDTWQQSQELVPCGSVNQYPGFGYSVALQGDTALVGAPIGGANGSAGAACVYDGAGAGWTLAQTVLAGDASGYDLFGSTFALDGDTLAVGAPDKLWGEGDAAFAITNGAIYVFDRSGGAWSQTDEIARTEPGAIGDGYLSDSLGSGGLSIDGSAILAATPHANFARGTVGVIDIYDVPAAADLSPASLDFALAAGTSDSSTVQLSNTGGAALAFQLVDGTVLSQTVESAPVAWGGQGCYYANDLADPVGSADNRWYRRFYFGEHPQVGASASIDAVTIGIESAPDGIPVNVKLYTTPHSVPVDTIDASQLVLIGSGSAMAEAGVLTSLRVPVTGTVQDTVANDLVVEYDIDEYDHLPVFFPGANPSPQTHPTFVSSQACGYGLSDPGVPAPQTGVFFWFHALIDVHLAAAASGIECANPATVTWLSVDPANGTVDHGGSASLVVHADATGLADGHYETTLCFATSDLRHSPIELPVSLTVGSGAADLVFRDGFDGPDPGG